MEQTLDQNETRRTGVSYDLSNLMGKRESNNYFVYDCGTHYSNGHLLILHSKIDSVGS